METTADRLSKAFVAAGEPGLAGRARRFEFDCLQAGDAKPMHRLINATRSAMVTNRKLAPLHKAIMHGEYWNTNAEVAAAKKAGK